MPYTLHDEKVYAVSELTAELRMLLERRYVAVRVVGEVTGLSMPNSGHIYFSLKDETASFPAVMFRSAVARMSGPLPDEGTEVECLGRLTMYEPRGKVQLVVEWMALRGEGALGLRFLALKNKLQKEGLFDPSKKRQLPFLPGKIGIVTSPTGAAIRDILKVLDQRFPSIPVLIYPVRVQGEGAAQQIAGAIDCMGDGVKVDVLIVGRGGGSMEDLWAFNEEQVVRSVVACKVPVISAVGHEVDLVLTDLAADVRALTPTAAAEMVVPDRQVLRKQVSEKGRTLSRSLGLVIAKVRNRLSTSAGRMRDPRLVMAAHRMRLDETAKTMQTLMVSRLKKTGERLANSRVRLASKDPRAKLGVSRSNLAHARSRLLVEAQRKLEMSKMQMEARKAALQRLSPLGVLKRGYSIVSTNDGAIVRSYTQVSAGDHIHVRLDKGLLEGQVKRALLQKAKKPEGFEEGD